MRSRSWPDRNFNFNLRLFIMLLRQLTKKNWAESWSRSRSRPKKIGSAMLIITMCIKKLKKTIKNNRNNEDVKNIFILCFEVCDAVTKQNTTNAFFCLAYFLFLSSSDLWKIKSLSWFYTHSIFFIFHKQNTTNVFFCLAYSTCTS